MHAYEPYRACFGDLHNHCAISYAHGTLDEALCNAGEQLDFCSITGHAHWPDMPPPDPGIQDILDFHHEGFAKLKAGWPRAMARLREANEEGRFVLSPSMAIDVRAGGAIDCVDVLRNGRLLRRFSETDVPRTPVEGTLRTKLFLELGWGRKGAEAAWSVRFGISAGRIRRVEPRFRGQEVVSPLEKQAGSSSPYCNSHWEPDGDRAVRFQTISTGHPSNVTNTAQGMCLEVEVPTEAEVWAEMNGRRVAVLVERLVEGSLADNVTGFGSPAYRFHRAPLPWEFEWSPALEDEGEGPDAYCIRVRQKNDQWAWSSPAFLR